MRSRLERGDVELAGPVVVVLAECVDGRGESARNGAIGGGRFENVVVGPVGLGASVRSSAIAAVQCSTAGPRVMEQSCAHLRVERLKPECRRIVVDRQFKCAEIALG